jgi:hypothetical protein
MNPAKKNIRIFDNGGKTADRYSVIYLDEPQGSGQYGTLYAGVGMSSNPFHPQGVGMHGEFLPGKHLGKKIAFSVLPADCQKLVLTDLRDSAETAHDPDTNRSNH